jgi:DNA-binding HxlR family transcriptional regulator
MPSLVKQSKQNTEMIVLEALYDDDLSWSELHRKTHLSKDALSKHLSGMRQRGILKESISHDDKTLRPSIKYSLKDSYKKKITSLIVALRNYSDWERKTREFSKISFAIWSRSDKNPKALKKHFEAIQGAVNYVFLSELLRTPSGEPLDEYVTYKAMELIRSLIWGTEFTHSLKLNEKESLETFRQEQFNIFQDASARMKWSAENAPETRDKAGDLISSQSAG